MDQTHTQIHCHTLKNIHIVPPSRPDISHILIRVHHEVVTVKVNKVQPMTLKVDTHVVNQLIITQ